MNLLLQSVAQAAVEATGAGQGFLLAVQGDRLCVVASAGRHPGSLLGQLVPAHDGPAGYVMGSGQPLVVNPDEPSAGDAGSVLCVPCSFDDRVLGVVQLVGKAGGSTFSYDDLHFVSALSQIAGTALHQGDAPTMVPPPPSEVVGELERLASADPVRYAALASMITALLGTGG